MLRKTIILLLFFALMACGPGKKRRTYSKTRTVTVEGSTRDTSPERTRKKEGRKNAKAEAIISTAMSYSGTRYKYGGNHQTRHGLLWFGLCFLKGKRNYVPTHLLPDGPGGTKNWGQQCSKGRFALFQDQQNRKTHQPCWIGG